MGPHQLCDLPDMTQVVVRPFVQVVAYRNRAHRGVATRAVKGRSLQSLQIGNIVFALFLPMREGFFRLTVLVGSRLGPQVLIVRLELGVLFRHHRFDSGTKIARLNVFEMR